MLNNIYKNKKKIIYFQKKGRCNFAVLECGKEIKSSFLGEIGIECHKCNKICNIGWRTGLLKKDYICNSCRLKGENNPFYNKTHTDESKKKQSLAKKGKYVGENNPFYNKTHTEESKNLIRSKQTWQKGKKNPFYNKTHTDESKKKISLANQNYQKNLSAEDKKEISKKLSLAQKKAYEKDPSSYIVNKRKANKKSLSNPKRYKMNGLESYFSSVLEKEFGSVFYFSEIFDGKQYDFVHKEKKIIIEVQGDYWHGNPNIYGLSKKPLNDIQKLNIDKDLKKKIWCENNQYNLLCFWEQDIKNNIQQIIKEIKDVI